MNRTALVLAVHGSRVEPAVNQLHQHQAEVIRERRLFDEVAVAFHHGDPHYSRVLDGLTARNVTVVPVFSSDGYYNSVVLPRELVRNERFDECHVRITDPLGKHAGVIDIVADRIRGLLHQFSLERQFTTLGIVGHGTPRFRQSQRTAKDLVNWLRRMRLAGDVLVSFLDDEPPVESLRERTTTPNLAVIPYLIAVGPHALSDVPRRVGLTVSRGTEPPFFGRVGERFVVCDAPLGSDSRIIDLLIDLAMSGCDAATNPTAPAETAV